KRHVEMAIDTGAEIVCLPWKAAIEAGLDPDRGQQTILESANGSETVARKLTVAKIRVGKFTLRDVECVVMPAENGDVTPLLGQTFLSKFNYRIDAGESVLLISSSSENKAPPRAKP